jgi:phosphoribosylglycinamide formyltransferase-1
MEDFINITLFASGSGTNAENIVKYFSNNKLIYINSVFVNNPNAGVIDKMKKLGKEIVLFDKEIFKSSLLQELKKRNTHLIVLAGFLWLVPENIINEYKGKIINIHPAILPSYGGKEMYGNKVHEKVLANKEKYSGITIHEVNNEYDKGRIIFQATCPVFETDTIESLANRIHTLEYFHFPKVIEAWALSLKLNIKPF